MNEHLLQSKIWEKYEKLEGKTTFRLTDADFDCLVTKGETPFGPYLYLPYGPTLKITQKSTKTPKSAKTTSSPSIAEQATSSPSDAEQTTTKTSQNSVAETRTQAKKSLQKALKALQELAKDQNAYFIRIEPTYAFTDADIASCAKNPTNKNSTTKKSPKVLKSHDLDPHYTWILDLENASEEELLKNMESRKVRYWRNAEKKGITIRKTKNPEEITILTDFLKNLGEKDKFIPQTELHLKNQLKSGDFATLYIAEYAEPTPVEGAKPAKTAEPEANAKKVPIAAALVYDYENTRYYAHAATDFEHRKFQAGSILLIQMILDAKREGKKFYDFWGITKSEDKNHPWYHFTQYKKSFGGEEVAYSGTYDIVLNPVKYRLYNLARKANRLIRKAR